MKKTLILSSLLILTVLPGHSAIKWWEQDTICRLDPSNCYTAMGMGFEPEYWDQTSECWGQKIICAAAQAPASSENKAMTKKEITARKNISNDYDITALNGDCFGVRKTSSNGSMATYNGKSVKVFCKNILENIFQNDEIESLTNGSILLRNTEPTCQELAAQEYVNVKDKNCYGKKYSQSTYYIDCETSDSPRLIIHNNADYTAPQGDAPKTIADAEKIFNTMYNTAKSLR